MTSETQRVIELDSLIRGAYAEIGTLQIDLIDAYKRKLNPAELGFQVANLGQEISAWKDERESISRRISERGQAIAGCVPNRWFVQKASRDQGAAPSRRAESVQKIKPVPSIP